MCFHTFYTLSHAYTRGVATFPVHQVAWAGKLEEVVRVAAPFVIIEEWSAEVDKEMTRIKVTKW